MRSCRVKRRYGEGDLALEIEFCNCHSGVMPIFVWFQAPIKGLGFLYFVSWTDKARSKPGEMSSYKNFDWWAEICFRFASLCSDLQFVVSCHEAFGSHMLKKIKWKVSLNQTCDPLIKRLLLALLLTGLAQATQRWCHTLQVTTRKQTQAKTHTHTVTLWLKYSYWLCCWLD